MTEAPTFTQAAAPALPESLSVAWALLLDAEPKMRIRNAAARLGVSEVELLATRVGDGVTRLQADWGALVLELEQLGEVMALTRNDHAVHEKIGVYRNASVEGPVGLVLDEAIDLRIFLRSWASGFAVSTPTGKGGKLRHSLQFFDRHGRAVHKLFLRDTSDHDAYRALVARHRAEDQTRTQPVSPVSEPDAPTPDDAIDVEGFQEAWRTMTDTHEFFGILRRFGVQRTQALRLAPEGMASPVDLRSPRRALEAAAAAEVPIMVFVGSPGMIQIHSGEVARLVETGPWFNVLDPGFNLHLRESGVASAWVVRKPTEDGTVTSLELFDANGGTVAMFFGARKPGKPELPGWRAIAEGLC